MKFADNKPKAKKLDRVWLVNPRGRVVDVVEEVAERMVRKEYFQLANKEEIAKAEGAIKASEENAVKKGRKTTPEKVERSKEA